MLAPMTKQVPHAEQAAAPSPGLLLYSGPAGKVWTNAAELYGLRAAGVKVQAVMPGGPHNQPDAAELAAVQQAAKGAYGALQPWTLFLGAAALVFGLGLLHVPLWVTLLLGLGIMVALVAWPVSRQYAAFRGLYERRDEVTLLLSETPTQMVSRLVEVGPDTPPQTLDASQQPVAVVVRGLPLSERIKLAGAVMRHTAMGQMAARRK